MADPRGDPGQPGDRPADVSAWRLAGGGLRRPRRGAAVVAVPSQLSRWPPKRDAAANRPRAGDRTSGTGWRARGASPRSLLAADRLGRAPGAHLARQPRRDRAVPG